MAAANLRSRHRVAIAGLAAILAVLCPNPARAQNQSPHQAAQATVQIEVLSLFHPTEFHLQPTAQTTLTLEIDGHPHTLSNSAQATITSSADGLSIQFPTQTAPLRAARLSIATQSSPNPQDFPRFWLEVPGKLRRQYTGTLVILPRASQVAGHLQAIVTMPLETAVASIVQAESPPNAPLEALKAQAVAARSFLAARQAGHSGFDFCDTTHCQFLPSPPPPGSPAAKATEATRSLILTWHNPATAQDQTLPALYGRSCGGRTRTLREIGIRSSSYPYYPVTCAYCARHPELRQPNTAAYGPGHGVGLCQLGAADMARHGATFAQILNHYYPNTRLTILPANPSAE